MDPLTLIVSALTAGAAAALQETAGTAIKDAYQSLITLLKRKLKKDTKATAALEGHAEDPDTWQKPLEKAVKDNGLVEDQEILKRAQKLLNLLESANGHQTNILEIHGNAQGVIVENTGSSVMNFHAPVRRQPKKKSKKRG